MGFDIRQLTAAGGLDDDWGEGDRGDDRCSPSSPKEVVRDVEPPTTGRQVAPPPGLRRPLLELTAGDRVHLALATGGHDELRWSDALTVTSVLLIDAGLVQVRWTSEDPEKDRAGYLLLVGSSYEAGAISAS